MDPTLLGGIELTAVIYILAMKWWGSEVRKQLLNDITVRVFLSKQILNKDVIVV